LWGFAASSIFAVRPSIMLDAMLRPMPERDPAPPIGDVLPTVGGKFFFVGAQKMYMRSVSYGPFAQGGGWQGQQGGGWQGQRW